METDEELVVLSLENKDFFGILISRYEEKLSRYIKRISKYSNEDRQDILQNVFINAYVNLRGFDTSLKFSSWIYRITHNEVINFFRKNKKKEKYGHLDIGDDILKEVVRDSSFLKDIDIKIERDLIKKTFEKMDLKYREVLILKFIEEKNYNEISDILQKPPGTIATLMHRAKKQFKKEYQKYYE